MRRARCELKLYFCNASPHHKFQGTGKTLIILSLIAASKNQLSRREKSIDCLRPVMTPLSFRHFPFSEPTYARIKSGLGATPQPSRLPSLVELMLHRHRTAPNCSIPKSYSNTEFFRLKKSEHHVNSIPLGDMLRENVPFYHHYYEKPKGLKPTINRKTNPRWTLNPGPKVMYLTSATLIVVPANLMSQWEKEVDIHCSNSLRVLILRTNSEVPSAKYLATDFDVCRFLL